MTKEVKECATCKFFEQGKGCSFCGNPEQTNKSLKEYVYYNSGCDLCVEGIAQSRVEFMKRQRTAKP